MASPSTPAVNVSDLVRTPVAVSSAVLCAAVLLVGAHACGAEVLRVLGGRDALPGELPYVVRVETREVRGSDVIMAHTCTATVISPTWVLTAAHCIHEGVELVIRYGSVHNPPGAADTFRSVVESIKHPRYLDSKKFKLNDIGLLKIEYLKLQQYGKLSSVPYSSLVGLEAVSAGYGWVNTSSGLQTTLDVKKPLQIVQVLLKVCTKEYGFIGVPSLCLTSLCGNKCFLCPGDSGGPTIHSTGVVGVSVSMYRPDIGLPKSWRSYHTAEINPVSPNLDWILSHVRP